MKILPFVVALSFSLPMFGQDAGMFRGNLQHTGVYKAAGVTHFNGIQWKFQTGGRVISSPAIVNGTAYIGSTDKNLYAVDVQSGTQKWKFATESAITSSPAVKDGTVYFGSYDGYFYALDTDGGKLRWKFQTGGEKRFTGKHLHGLQPEAEAMPDPWDFFLSSPSIWNNTVYFGSGDGNVYALDATSGKLKWKFQTGDVVHSSPAIADGSLYIGSWDSYLYKLDASTGKEIWKFKTGEDPNIHNHVGIQSSPVVADGLVYFGCRDSNVYAVDVQTGKQQWFFSTNGSWVNNSPVVYDGKLFFGTSLPGLMHAVDAKTGKTVFSLETKVPVFSSMAVAGDVLYLGTFDGKLTAVDLKAQKPAWVFQTDAAKQNAPTLINPDGTLKFEAAMTQNFYDDMVVGISKLFTLGTILSSPVVADNVVYVGSTDGYLYALK